MSKIVVFGANGFIGQHLVRGLAEDSAHSIIAFDRFTAYQHRSEYPFGELGNVQVVVGDFFNRNDIASTLDSADYVFHLVSTTTPAASDSDPLIDIDSNVRGSVEFFDLCTEHNIKKVVFLSSGGTIYGDIDSDAIDESTTPKPRSPYGIGKLTIEHYLRYFKHTAGLDYVVYRVANPYGPGQNIHGKQGVIPIFMRKLLMNEAVTIFGSGEMVRDYLYIDDLITMIVGSYAKSNQHSEYNIGSGKGVSVNQLIDTIERCTSHSVAKEYVKAPATFIQKSVLSIDRFTKEFGVVPVTSLEEGINRTWNYVKALI